MVTVTSHIPKSRHDEVVLEIQRVVLATPSLTPRPEQELRAALRSYHLAVAQDKGKIIGWLLSTPYSSATQELGMAYIMPTHRSTGLLQCLIDELIERRPISIAVTYEMALKKSLMKHWGFEPSTLREFIFVSKGRFLLNRLTSVRSVGAVISHTSKKKPLYLINRMGK